MMIKIVKIPLQFLPGLNNGINIVERNLAFIMIVCMALFSYIRKRQQISGCGESEKCDQRVEDSFNRGIQVLIKLDQGLARNFTCKFKNTIFLTFIGSYISMVQKRPGDCGIRPEKELTKKPGWTTFW